MEKYHYFKSRNLAVLEIISLVALMIFFLGLKLFLAITVLLVIPGFFLFLLFERSRSYSLIEIFLLSFVYGIVAVVLFAQLSHWLGIHFNAISYLTFFTTAAILLAGKLEKRIKIKMFPVKEEMLIFLVLIASLVTRILPVSKLYAPLFGDPAVEGTLARVIIENDLIPKSWKPFLPLKLHHQFGFASLIALISSFSSLSIAKTILLFTQLIHALFPLSIYFFVKQVTKNNLQALSASLIALAAAFPTYIFIAGMNAGVLSYFLVPFLAAMSINFLRNPKKVRCFSLFFLALATYTVHPTSIFFLALILLPFLLFHLIKEVRLKTLFMLAICLGLPFLSVFSHLFSQSLSKRAGLVEEQWKIQAKYINPYTSIKWKELAWAIPEPFFVFFDNKEGVWYLSVNKLNQKFLMSHFANLWLFALFVFSIFEIFRRKNLEGYAAIILYFLFLMFSTYQAYFKLKFPGYQAIYPSRVKFFLVLPISYLLSFGLTAAPKLKRPNLILLILLLPLLLHPIYMHLLRIGSYSPVGVEEIKAFKWIERNVPSNCTILNFVRRVETEAFIGDAGEWIPAFTGRKVVFPATSITDDIWELKYRQKIMNLTEEGNLSAMLPLLKKLNVCYVFVTERKSYFPLTYKIVSPSVFEGDKHFSLVYKNSEVSIFKVNY